MFLRLGRLFRAVGRDILVLWYACRNPATPLHLKLAALLLGLYVLSPIDLVPDWLVLLGMVDDVTLLALGIPVLLRFVPERALPMPAMPLTACLHACVSASAVDVCGNANNPRLAMSISACLPTHVRTRSGRESDMPQQNVETIRGLYDAFRKGDTRLARERAA